MKILVLYYIKIVILFLSIRANISKIWMFCSCSTHQIFILPLASLWGVKHYYSPVISRCM